MANLIKAKWFDESHVLSDHPGSSGWKVGNLLLTDLLYRKKVLRHEFNESQMIPGHDPINDLIWFLIQRYLGNPFALVGKFPTSWRLKSQQSLSFEF